MEFFGMGMGEILLILIIALIIFGPGKVPEIARKVGKAMNTIKNTSSELTAQITRELDAEEAASRSHSPTPPAGDNMKAPPAALPEAGAGNTSRQSPQDGQK